MRSRAIETSTGEGWLGPDGIYRYYYKPETWVTAESAREIISKRVAVMDGTPHPLYTDMSTMVELTKEAREAFSSDASVTALALRTGNVVSRVIANFFLGLHRPSVPVRLVATESEGLVWLAKFVPVHDHG